MILYVENNEGPRMVHSSSGSYHQSPARHISSDGFITIVCLCVVCSEKVCTGSRLLSIFGNSFKKKSF